TDDARRSIPSTPGARPLARAWDSGAKLSAPTATGDRYVADDEQLKRERDLYLRLLDLGSQEELEPFLDETLGLVVELIGAHQGYLELTGDDSRGGTPRWWAAHGFSETELDAVRAAISGGIVAAALETGKTIVTDSALHDQRFESKQSVQLG